MQIDLKKGFAKLTACEFLCRIIDNYVNILQNFYDSAGNIITLIGIFYEFMHIVK